jgi:acyl-CoA synthetase (AMP-forming)/AMP-acid ligase II
MVAPPGFTFYDNTKVLPKIAAEVPSIKRFVIMDDIEHKYHLSEPLARSVAYEDYLAPYSSLDKAALPQTQVSPHDMVNVQFTSGSTGLPKPVALSHYNIMNCGRNIWQQTRMTAEDVICLPVPLFHSFGMIVGISSSTVAGSALVLPHEIFNAEKTLLCIEMHRHLWSAYYVHHRDESRFVQQDGPIHHQIRHHRWSCDATRVAQAHHNCIPTSTPVHLLGHDGTQLLRNDDARNRHVRKADYNSRQTIP